MPKKEYDHYFTQEETGNRGIIEQQNVGVCYGLGAIDALLNSPYAEMFIRAGTEKRPNGSWNVRVPLFGSRDVSRVLPVTPGDLQPQVNPMFLKRKTGNWLPDFRRKLYPVGANEGIQVLEAAFIKATVGTLDRSAVDKGGRPFDILSLFGGECFQNYAFEQNDYDAERKTVRPRPLEAFEPIAGAYVDHFLEEYDLNTYIATACSLVKPPLRDWRAGLKRLRHGIYSPHAYSIIDVDKEKDEIKLANPHDTSKPTTLTLQDFKKLFHNIHAVRIDNVKLLKSMEQHMGSWEGEGRRPISPSAGAVHS